MDAMKRIAQCGFGLLLTCSLLGLPAWAQSGGQSSDPSPSSSGSSLGDYARQVRKDPGQPKAKPRSFDNDNLPKDDKLSIVGQPARVVSEPAADAKPAEAPAAAAPAEGGTTPQTPNSGDAKTPAAAKAPAKSPADQATDQQAAWKQWEQRITTQKDQIDLLQREFDVLQREYQIRAAAFYADAGNRLRNSGSWDKTDAEYKQQIADKQKAVDDAKQKLEDMMEDARKAGVPASVREP
jgi:hypothetical protein